MGRHLGTSGKRNMSHRPRVYVDNTESKKTVNKTENEKLWADIKQLQAELEEYERCKADCMPAALMLEIKQLQAENERLKEKYDRLDRLIGMANQVLEGANE